ncbi:hypothetical protein BHE74_00014359 [Ensete ventricosum]|nr:hypothetical protein BHE74_00014359 [Ensete ventricosum]
MLRNVDLLNVNILTAVKLKVFSGMVYNARYVLQEVVFCVRRCGISFEYTLVLVKNQTAVYHDAGEHPTATSYPAGAPSPTGTESAVYSPATWQRSNASLDRGPT